MEGLSDVLSGKVTGSIGEWRYYAQPDEVSQGILVYSVFPSTAPADRRQALAELAARANYLLRYGNLEIDFSDGQIRARTSARGGGEPLDFNVVAELVRANLEVAELLFPLVQRVAVEGADPAAVIAGLLEQLN